MRRLLAVLAVVVLAGAAYLWAPWRAEPPIRRRAGRTCRRARPTGRCCGRSATAPTAATRARSSCARMKRKRFDRVLYLGDVYGSGHRSACVLGDGSAADYRERYDPIYGAFAAQDRADAGQPRVAPARRRLRALLARRCTASRRPPSTRSTIGGWQVLSLNSEAPHDAGSAQVRWLRAQVRAPGTCRLAFWHRAALQRRQPQRRARRRAAVGRAARPRDDRRRRPRPQHAALHGRSTGSRSTSRARAGTAAIACATTAASRSATTATTARCASSCRPGRARMAFVSAGGRILDVSTVRCAR